MVSQVEKLEKEYYAAILYGPSKKKNRRPAEEIETDLRNLPDIDPDETLRKIQGNIEKLRELAGAAEKLHRKGLEKDAPEVRTPGTESYTLRKQLHSEDFHAGSQCHASQGKNAGHRSE